MKSRYNLSWRKVATAISPAGLFLRLFAIALVGGPAFVVSWESDRGIRLVWPTFMLLAYFWFWLGKRIRGRPSLGAEPVIEARPVAGLSKLLALLVIDSPSAIHSLTGPTVVAIDPTSSLPVLWETERPTRFRLLIEGLFLLGLAALWTLGSSWATEILSDEAFLGLMIAILGTGVALGTLLQRFGWAAGAYPVGGEVWAAPLIPREGPNRFRAMVSLNRRILVRPDILAAPYQQYLLAHERAHLVARNYRLVWWEQALCLLILSSTGVSLPYVGWFGLVVLLLLPLQRLLFCHLSYQSELAADAAAAKALGVEPCLGALATLAAEVRPSVIPRWQRYSPTIQERIEHLQRFEARPGQS